MHTASVYSFLAVQLLNTSVHNYPTFLCRQLVGKSAPFVCCVAGKEVRQHGVTVVLGQGLDSGGAMYKAAERRLAVLMEKRKVVKQFQGNAGAFIIWLLPNKTSWWKVLNNFGMPISPCMHAHLCMLCRYSTLPPTAVCCKCKYWQRSAPCTQAGLAAFIICQTLPLLAHDCLLPTDVLVAETCKLHLAMFDLPAAPCCTTAA